MNQAQGAPATCGLGCLCTALCSSAFSVMPVKAALCLLKLRAGFATSDDLCSVPGLGGGPGSRSEVCHFTAIHALHVTPQKQCSLEEAPQSPRSLAKRGLSLVLASVAIPVLGSGCWLKSSTFSRPAQLPGRHLELS